MPCLRCGVCCTEYQPRLSLMEARHIAGEMGVAWEDFLNRYTDQRWPGKDSFLLRQQDGHCVFLEHAEGDNTAGCLIHSFKPSACSGWTPGLHQRECRLGLSSTWGLTASPAGKICGPAEKVRCFQLLLHT